MSAEFLSESPPGEGDGTFVDEHDVRERVLVALSKVGLALRSEAWRDTSPRGLNPTQAQLLIVLARRPDEGWRLSGLADALGVSAPTVSDSVAALERKGLVSKGRAVDDRRALAVRATAEGRAEAASMSEWPDLLLGAVDSLTDDERGVFLRVLVKMIRSLQERGLVSPSRMCVTCRYFQPGVHDDARLPHHCGFVGAPFGDASLRLECTDHDPLVGAEASALWRRFLAADPSRPGARA